MTTKMITWINSIEMFQKLHDFSQVILILSLAMGLMSTIALWLLGKQIDKFKTEELKTIKTQNKEFEGKLSTSEQLRIDAEQKLKEEIEKTNKKIAPPTISEADFKRGVDIFSTLPKRQFVIKVMSEDFEGQDLGNLLAKMLSSAGWALMSIQPHGGWRFDDGIKIIVHSNTKEIDTLYGYLKERQFNPHLEESAHDEVVRIFIGKIHR